MPLRWFSIRTTFIRILISVVAGFVIGTSLIRLLDSLAGQTIIENDLKEDAQLLPSKRDLKGVALVQPKKTENDLEEIASDERTRSNSIPTFQENVSCQKLFANKSDEIAKAETIQRKFSTFKAPATMFVNLAKDCNRYISDRGYITEPLNSEEEHFPIAYSIIVYKDFEQIERLLRMIYRPQNFYCFHVDAKSRLIRKAMIAISKCFNNVFLSSTSHDVVWATFSTLAADLACMKDLLLKYRKWKYAINLTGQEWPLKTNWELVQILRTLNGTNLIQAWPIDTEQFINRVKYVWNGQNRTRELKEPLPVNITLAKGTTHAVFSRAFIHFISTNRKVQKFKDWLSNTGFSDETFYNSLQNSPQLGVPGIPKDSKNGFPQYFKYKERHKVWKMDRLPCHGKYLRSICIPGVGDLPSITNSNGLFLNKFILNYQPLALDCTEELMWNRTRDEYRHSSSEIGFDLY